MSWSPERDDALKVRLYNFATQLRAMAWEAFQIGGLVQANRVMESPEFAQPRRGIDPADAAELVGTIGDLVAFLQNGPVPQKDREAVLHRILGGPLQ